ncbi:MAG TPA: PHP domain-containing protein [Bacteroidota bacterium]|nr:PHP domain-containing protein [Bacteroidota bacterium]
MDGKADLHLHTTYSDGALSPSELVDRARQAGLTAISITDHDHTGALGEALALGARAGIEVIPGVELSTMVGESDVHILGYFIDPGDARLQEYLALFRVERRKRAERIVRKLNGLNVPLTIDGVLRRAGDGSVGRPHIATALVEEGLIGTYQEAFTRYIGFGKPAYEKKYMISPREAISMIAAAGGLSFIAHPSTFIEEGVLLDIIHAGIDGIEVVHPSHTPELVAHYRGIVGEYFLLASGGSDFHGGKRNDLDAFGRYTVSEAELTMMRRRLRQAPRS